MSEQPGSAQPPSKSLTPSPSRHRTRGQTRAVRNQPRSSSPEQSPNSVQERGRARTRRPSNVYTAEALKRRGYKALSSSFGKSFYVEKRWRLVREMGSGAYGFVISAKDDISGETVAIKCVTRIFDRIQLAKRALREITLLRHFSPYGHENITGLIDIDALSPDFDEFYIFMEPMEADLHQIVRSGQALSGEHCQYFLYQILRGMKFIHSAKVIHRDLKPGNLLVNSDCELKICDFGLSRGFSSLPDQNLHMTEYVATRWYRAPEIMLAFRRYDTAIDVWSIGCILAELLTGRPIFKGKDYVDQLSKIIDILGTPKESTLKRIGSEKAQAFVRSLPIKKPVPFTKIMTSADDQGLHLLSTLLAFDPAERVTIKEALGHPWLAAYHDEEDEPLCPDSFGKWQEFECYETIDQYRTALWKEIQEYRREARTMNQSLSGLPLHSGRGASQDSANLQNNVVPTRVESPQPIVQDNNDVPSIAAGGTMPEIHVPVESPTLSTIEESSNEVVDPLISYARRSGTMHQQPTMIHRASSTHQHFPSTNPEEQDQLRSGSYIVPARSRTTSAINPDANLAPTLLRTLSTVSIHESVEGLPGGLASIAPVGRYITERTEAADAPPSNPPSEYFDTVRLDDSENDSSCNEN